MSSPAPHYYRSTNSKATLNLAAQLVLSIDPNNTEKYSNITSANAYLKQNSYLQTTPTEYSLLLAFQKHTYNTKHTENVIVY